MDASAILLISFAFALIAFLMFVGWRQRPTLEIPPSPWPQSPESLLPAHYWPLRILPLSLYLLGVLAMLVSREVGIGIVMLGVACAFLRTALVIRAGLRASRSRRVHGKNQSSAEPDSNS